MKKIFLFLTLALSLKMAQAAGLDTYTINSSSYIAEAATLQSISSQTIRGGIFVGVVISSPMPLGSISFFDSNGVMSSTIGIVSTGNIAPDNRSGAQTVLFNVRISSGLTYTSTGIDRPGLTVIYKVTGPAR